MTDRQRRALRRRLAVLRRRAVALARTPGTDVDELVELADGIAALELELEVAEADR